MRGNQCLNSLPHTICIITVIVGVYLLEVQRKYNSEFLYPPKKRYSSEMTRDNITIFKNYNLGKLIWQREKFISIYYGQSRNSQLPNYGELKGQSRKVFGGSPKNLGGKVLYSDSELMFKYKGELAVHSMFFDYNKIELLFKKINLGALEWLSRISVCLLLGF